MENRRSQQGSAEPWGRQGVSLSKLCHPTGKPDAIQEHRGLFVKNVPCSMTSNDLKQLFSEYGKVQNVVMRPGQEHAKFTWAIVNTESVKDTIAMITGVNKKPPLNLQVMLALTQEEKNQRRREREVQNHTQVNGKPLNLGRMSEGECNPSVGFTSKAGTGTGGGGPGRRSHLASPVSEVKGNTLERTVQEAVSVLGESSEEGHRRRSVEDTAHVASSKSSSINNNNNNNSSRDSGVGSLSSATSHLNANKVVEMGKGSVVLEHSKPRACVFCGSMGKLRCSVCKAWYCSKVCQVDDWFYHKDKCNPPPPLDDPCTQNTAMSKRLADESCGSVSDSLLPLPAAAFNLMNCEEDFPSIKVKEAKELCCSPEKVNANEKNSESLIVSVPDKVLGSQQSKSPVAGKNTAENLVVSLPEGSLGNQQPKFPVADKHTEKSLVVNLPEGSLGNQQPKSPVADKHTAESLAVCAPESSLRNQQPKSPVAQTKGQLNPPRMLKSIFEVLELDTVHQGFITLMDSYQQFSAAVIAEGMECIFSSTNEMSKSPDDINFKPEAGSLVAAFSPSEESWYRANVLEYDSQRYKVCYIDFGNVETVTLIKPLPEGPFSELPGLAVVAKLNTIVKPDIQEKLKSLIQVGSPIMFKVIGKDLLSLTVSLFGLDDMCCDRDAAVNYTLRPLLAHPSQHSPLDSTPVAEKSANHPRNVSTPRRNRSQESDLQEAHKHEFFKNHCDSVKDDLLHDNPSPEKLEVENLPKNNSSTSVCQNGVTSSPKWNHEKINTTAEDPQQENLIEASVQDQFKDCNAPSPPSGAGVREAALGDVPPRSLFVVPMSALDLVEQLAEMSVTINKHCNSSPQPPYQPKHGDVCLAKFSEDGRWYRAVCVKSAPHSSVVVFVDFGNTDEVSHSNIRQIPKEFLELPCLALYAPHKGESIDCMKQETMLATRDLMSKSHASSAAFTFLTLLKLTSESVLKQE